MGVAFSFVSIGLLIGTPIEGALLRHRDGDSSDYTWYKAIIFCGVRLPFFRSSAFLISICIPR